MDNITKKKSVKIGVLVMLGVIILVAGIAIAVPLLFHPQTKASLQEKNVSIVKEEPVSLNVSCVGDIMVHSPQIPSQYNSATGLYDYNNNFELVKKYIKSSDLSICNLETTFAGAPYAGYPLFNAPEALADAIKNAGWDVAINANNHIMDTGLDGLKRTLEVSRKAGLKTTGAQLEDEKNYAMVNVKGVKMAVVAYSYETGTVNGRTGINGSPISPEVEPYLNTFNYATLDEDLGKIRSTIIDARKSGAEIVICYFHWGEEYQRTPNDYQLSMAKQVADMGADMIFASHPHVLQNMDMLTNETTGKQVPVFYSMGNLISNQRLETLDNRYTEQGIIAQVNLEYRKSTKEIVNIKMNAMPLWVDKYKNNGKDVYSVVPLDSDMATDPSLAASGNLIRAQQALDDVKVLLGEPNIRTN